MTNGVDPKEDGYSHINIYSKGSTALGRFLSNFSDCHVITEDGYFRTIEGYCYWLSTKHEPLRDFPGWQAKQVGRKLRGLDWNDTPGFQDKILKAILYKIMSHNNMKDLFIKSNLPFYHYYVYNEKVVEVKDGIWIISFIDWLRTEMKEGRLK